MADLSRTIDIIFGAIDNITPEINNISKEFAAFDSSVQSIADPFANFTKSLLTAEAGIAALGGAMVAFSVNEAGALQTSINEIGTLFNATPEQVEKLRSEILDFGKDSVFAFENITESTYNMISATGDVEGAVNALGIAEKGAVVGATDLNTAVNALTTVTNAYGISLDDSNDVLGAFIIAVQNGKTTLPELEASIGRVAATAAGSKVPFDDLLAAIAALTAGGINTAESMTGINAVLSELAKPSDALKMALNSVSLETDGLQAVMQQLDKATAGNFTSMTALFGSIEATKTALVLGTDAAGVFNKSLDAMDNKSTVLAQNFDLMAKNTDLALQSLTNNIRATLIEVGAPLLDEFGSAVGALNGIFKTLGIEISSGSLKPLEAALERFAQSASASLNDIAKALPEALGSVNFSSLIASFEGLGAVFEDVFGKIFGDNLDLSKPEDLAKALQTAVNIAESLVNITTGIIEQFNPIFAAIGEAGKRVGETSTETDAAIGKFLGALTLLSEFGTAMGSLAFVVNETGTDVARVFDLFGGAAKTVVNVVQAAFDLVVGTIVKSMAGIATAFELLTPDFIGDPWGDIAKSLTELGDAVGQNFARNMSEAGDGIELIGKGLGLIEQPAVNATESFKKVAETSGELSKNLSDFGLVLDPVTGGLKEIGAESIRSSEEIDKILDSIYGVSNASGEATNNLNDGTDALRAYGVSADQSATSLEKTTTATDTLSESQRLAVKNAAEMEKILVELSSNESIKRMEFTAEIRVAEIQAQAQQVAAAYDAIGVSVASTNDLIGKLFSTDAPDWDRFGFDTRAAADAANERAEALLKSQLQLNDAQIYLMRQRADALSRGNAKINIDVQNAEPEMQMLLKSLFGFIQVEANAEGLEVVI